MSSQAVNRPSKDSPQPRILFLSLPLFLSFWDQLPAKILLDCLVLVGTKRSFLFPSNNSVLKRSDDCPIAKLCHSDKVAMKMLSVKCQHNTLIFLDSDSDDNIINAETSLGDSMQCDTDIDDGSSDGNESKSIIDYCDGSDDNRYFPNENLLISHLWYYISSQLQRIIDPVTESQYPPLRLSQAYWKSIYFNPKVLLELAECKGNYAFLELILSISYGTQLLIMKGFNFEYQLKLQTISALNTINIDKYRRNELHNEFGDICDNDGFVYLDSK